MAQPDPWIPEDYVFGPVVGANDVDNAIYTIINRWQVSYLREVARRAGEAVDELKPFRSWRVSHELERMPEDQAPTLIIVNEGLQDEPTKRGSVRPGKTYWAIYRYRIGCLATAKGKKINAAPRANKLAKMYGEAVKLILIQKRDNFDEDMGILGMMDWIDEAPGPLDSEDDRTIAIWQEVFNVEVPNSASWATGPLVPEELPDPPNPDAPIWPIVQTVDVELIKTPIGEPFPEPEPPEPPPPDDGIWGSPIGEWSSWIMRGVQNDDNMFAGDFRMNWDTPTMSDLLWIHYTDGIGVPCTTELQALQAGQFIRLKYPQSDTLDPEAEAIWQITGGTDKTDHIEFSVVIHSSTGDFSAHLGEDVSVRYSDTPEGE